MKYESVNPAIKVLDDYKAAVYAKDVEAFAALYDENVIVFDIWGPGWIHQGRKSRLAMAEEWFGSLVKDQVVVEYDRMHSKQTSDLAFVSAFLKYTAVSPEGKTLRSLENRMSLVLEPKNGVWKITHEHTSAPAEHGTLKVSLMRQ